MGEKGLMIACLSLAMACNDSPAEGAGGSAGVGGAGGQGGQPMLEVGETCVAFCGKAVVECDAFPLDEPECQQLCQQDLNSEYQYAEACGVAVEGVFECVTELDNCEEVEAWRDQVPSDGFPCLSAVSVYDALIAAGICPPPV